MIRLQPTQGRHMVLEPRGDVELPDLTVIIGPNGVGKTALLRAIDQGQFKVKLDGHKDELSDNDIRLLRNGELPETLSKAVPRGAEAEGDEGHWALASHLIATLQPASDRLVKRFGRDRLPEFGEIWREGADALLSRLGVDPDDAKLIKEAFELAEGILAGRELSGSAAVDIRPAVQAMARRLQKPCLSVTEEEYQIGRRIIGHIDPLEPTVTAIFQQYGAAWRRNVELGIRDNYSKTKRALAPEHLDTALGPPPWNLISQAVTAFGLPYRVREVELGNERPDYEFRLVRSADGAEVRVEQLSSGEQILLRFALAIFDYSSMDLRLTLPKLLLCDELDASLHPEILERWIRAIRFEIVDRLGIKCILTTHSPITAALVADEALFELALGRPGPTRIAKQSALNRLLVGVPALAIDFSNRRQVIVESETDALLYQELQQILNPVFNLPRSRDFIAAARNGTGDAGCSAVKHLVETAAASGNISMFGLIDWDGNETRGDDRIVVLGRGERYAIENAILDPLLLGAFLIQRGDLAGEPVIAFEAIPELSSADRQALVDRIEGMVTFPRGSSGDRSLVSYVDGTALEVSNAWTKWRGHDLEAEIVRVFSSLEPMSRGGAGELMKRLVQRTISTLPGLCPKVVAEALEELAAREIGERRQEEAD